MNPLPNNTLEEWVIRLLELGGISVSTSQALRSYDSRKEERLLFLHESIGLPIIKTASVQINDPDSATRIEQWLEGQTSLLYSVRVQPIESRGSRQRVHGVTKVEAIEFTSKVRSEGAPYQVIIAPYFIPEVSGHIVVAKTGITVEAGRCRLMSISQQWVSSDVLVHGFLHFPKHGMVYTTEDTEMRRIMWGAVRHLMNHRHSVINPLHFPEIVLGYFEFIFVASKGYFFFDFNQSQLCLSPPEGTDGIEMIENDFPIPKVHQFLHSDLPSSSRKAEAAGPSAGPG